MHFKVVTLLIKSKGEKNVFLRISATETPIDQSEHFVREMVKRSDAGYWKCPQRIHFRASLPSFRASRSNGDTVSLDFFSFNILFLLA